jgi:hypothetical protein
MRQMKTYSETEIAEHLGVIPSDLPKEVKAVIASSDFRHTPLEGKERDALLLKALQELDRDLAVAGAHRHARWEAGWSENLEAFRASGFDLAALVPKFVRKGEPVRMLGEYIQPHSPDFDIDYIRLLVIWAYARFFQEATEIHEFGCGTAQNLVPAARLFPGRPLFGYDWAKASRDIISEMRRHHGFTIEGHVFDMFHPDPSHRLNPGAGVITIGSLEQLGEGFGPFLDYVLAQAPAIVVNFDCFNELYDPNHLPDVLAERYDRKRGYLYGWITRLDALAKQGKIEILDRKRTYGNTFHDGHSYVAWRPLK